VTASAQSTLLDKCKRRKNGLKHHPHPFGEHIDQRGPFAAISCGSRLDAHHRFEEAKIVAFVASPTMLWSSMSISRDEIAA
jgi:hypothetical protein